MMSGRCRFRFLNFSILCLLIYSPALCKNVSEEANRKRTSEKKVLSTSFYHYSAPGDAGDDQTLCGVASTNLDAQTGPGTWSTSSTGVIITDPSSPTSQVTNLNPGSNVFTWTVGAVTDDVEIFVADLPPAPVVRVASLAGPFVCDGTSVRLTVDSPDPDYSYQWYKNGVPLGGTFGDLILAGPAASGDYQLRATDMTTNCESELSAVQTVSIEAIPDVPVINASRTLGCDGEPITLTASEAPLNGSYLWSRNGATLPQNTRSIVISSVAQSGDYTVIVLSERGCTSGLGGPQTITIEPLPPTPSINTSGNVICADGSLVELESSLVAPDGGTYIWLKDGVEVNGQDARQIVLSSFNQTGSYTVRTVDGDGAMCISEPSSAQAVQIYQLPSLARPGDAQQLCEETATNLLAETPIVGVGTWSTSSAGITINDPNDPGSTVTGLATGTQTFTWQVDNGACIGTPENVTVEVFNAPSPAITEGDKLICDEISTPVSANTPVVGTGEWRVVSGTATIDSDDDPATTITGLVPETEVVLSWTISNGTCVEETDQLLIQVGASPSLAEAGSGLMLCSAKSARLSAADPAIGNGQWTVLAGTATLVDVNDPETEVNDLVPGENVTLRWTVANDCGTSNQDVTIENEVAPDVANAGDDVELCGVNNTTLAGTGAGGVWTVVSGSALFADNSDPLSPVSDLSVGVNILKYSITGAICTGTEDEVVITVYEEPDDAVAGADLFFCAGESIADISAQPPAVGRGMWSVISGSGTIQNSDQALTQVRGLLPGETLLRWSVENGNCITKTDDLLITVYLSPAVAREELEICMGESVQLEAVGGDRYQWQPAGGLNDAFVANPVASPEESTEYTVDIINDNCVTTSLKVNVVVDPLPVLVTISDTTVFANEEIQLFASGASQYQWTPAAGLNDPAGSDPVAMLTESTTYTVTGTNEFNCTASAQVTVLVNEGFEIFVPDLFTPNGDQMNDVLYVNTLGIRALDFRIFDRMGQEVFSTSDKEKGWDGTFNGSEQSMDSYVYYVIAETVEGEKISRKGSIQLVR